MKEELTPIWKALVDPHRRAILDLLRERPRTTGALCSAFQVSRFAIMKHLTVLEEAGLVIVRREGRERWNYLNAIPLQQMYERWLRPYDARVATSLLQMKHYVELREEREQYMSQQHSVEPAISLFQTELEVVLKASPEHIFQALTLDIHAWWGAENSWGRGTLILEPAIGKHLYEDFGNGDGAIFGTVTYVERNKKLVIEGNHGLSDNVHGFISYELVPQGESTLLKFSHRAFGEISERSRANFSTGWKEMLDVSLRKHVE